MHDTIIYLVRHGQTEWNVEHRLQGHQDSPLTELGRKQAMWLGEALERTPIDVIYSSFSPRARMTAEYIRGTREIDILESNRLMEINMGEWEGLTQDDVMNNDPEQHRHFWHDPEMFRVAGAESFRDVLTRAVDCLHRILAEHQGRSILLVTHTVVVKLLMAYFEQRPIQAIWDPPYIHPACLSKIVCRQDGFHIELHGDISHYKEEPDLS